MCVCLCRAGVAPRYSHNKDAIGGIYGTLAVEYITSCACVYVVDYFEQLSLMYLLINILVSIIVIEKLNMNKELEKKQ